MYAMDERLVRYRRVLTMRAEGASFDDIAAALGNNRASAFNTHSRASSWLSDLGVDPDTYRATLDLRTIAWAAGFFDGEGCVFGYESRHGTGHQRFTFGVVVAQIALEPLEVLAAGWGGTIAAKRATNPRHADQWRWQIRGRDAARFLSDILPYLRVKREAAQAAIPCLKRVHAAYQPFTEDEIVGRRAAIAVIRASAHKGRRPR